MLDRSNFIELLRAIIAGKAVEITSCALSSVWIPVRISAVGGYFEIFVDNEWRAAPIGNSGCVAWRYTHGPSSIA